MAPLKRSTAHFHRIDWRFTMSSRHGSIEGRSRPLLIGHTKGFTVPSRHGSIEATKINSPCSMFMGFTVPAGHGSIEENSKHGGAAGAASLNFTQAAEEKNAENLLVIRDKALAEKNIKNWQEHAKHSEVYTGRAR
jgi:phosphatidylserine/phosphatidylglycerophosphate/cardiolipin synthase-like enzyme